MPARIDPAGWWLVVKIANTKYSSNTADLRIIWEETSEPLTFDGAVSIMALRNQNIINQPYAWAVLPLEAYIRVYENGMNAQSDAEDYKIFQLWQVLPDDSTELIIEFIAYAQHNWHLAYLFASKMLRRDMDLIPAGSSHFNWQLAKFDWTFAYAEFAEVRSLDENREFRVYLMERPKTDV